MHPLQILYETAFKAQQQVEDVTYQCCIETGEHYYLEINDSQLKFHTGCHPNPTLRLYFPDTQTPADIAQSHLDPMTAFLEGRIRSDGHLLLVMQYLMLFGPLPENADLR